MLILLKRIRAYDSSQITIKAELDINTSQDYISVLLQY